MIRPQWQRISKALLSHLKTNEVLSLNLSGEETLFLRFNHGKVRQSTEVHQFIMELRLQCEKRNSSVAINLSGDGDFDLLVSQEALARARAEIESLPEDPYFVPHENHGVSEFIAAIKLPSALEVAMVVGEAHGNVDQAGFYAGGPKYRASLNSLGQDHWFESHSYFYDFSIFTENLEGQPKAIKGLFSKSEWEPQALLAYVNSLHETLPALQRPEVALKPGAYRAYLAPAAVAEIIQVLGYRGLELSDVKQGNSGLLKFLDSKNLWSEKFNMTQNFKTGMAPRFNGLGELAPEELSIIEKGQLKNWLVSSRASKEYGFPSTGSDGRLRSVEIKKGTLKEKEILKSLGTGLYLSDLHYLNWSDIQAARVTGMTRYSCFWVEDGEIKAPIKDLRFDDSLFSLFGSELIDLTESSQNKIDVSTYFESAVGGLRVPGILVGAMNFKM